jgi:hypothetical protein
MGFDVPVDPPFRFRFEFGVNQATPGPGQVLDGISLSFVGTTDGGNAVIAAGDQGIIRRQER